MIVLRSGNSFFADSLGGDMLSKLASLQESHGAPPGLYFVLFWLTFWPGSALAGLGSAGDLARAARAGAQFLLAWLVPSWIVFEIVITKLPHYVLPLVSGDRDPAGRRAGTPGAVAHPWIVRGTSWWFVVPALFSVAAVVGAISLTLQPTFLAWPFAAGAMIFGLFAWWLYDDNEAERSILNAIVASWFLSVVVYGVVLPSLSPLFPSVELARALRNVECVGPRAAAAGYHEPSLVFITGTSTLLTDGSGAADFLGQGSCRFALIESRQERAFAQRAEAIGLRYNVATRIDGYNFSRRAPDLGCGVSLRKGPNEMTAAGGGYFRDLATLTTASLAQLVRAPSHSRRSIAAQRLARHWILLLAGCGIAIIVLMLAVDVPTISLMPARGTPSLWPVRFVTNFGDSDRVLWTVGGLLLIVVIVTPMLRGARRPVVCSPGDPYRVHLPCGRGAQCRRRSPEGRHRPWPPVRRRSRECLLLFALHLGGDGSRACHRPMPSPRVRWRLRWQRSGRGLAT